MLVIVGHGPSIEGCDLGDFIDSHKVCRLRRANVNSDVGFRTDIVCSSQIRYKRKGKGFWYLSGALRDLCVDMLRPFDPNFVKPSTGLSACIIARDKGYTSLGLLGFDYTLHPDKKQNWRHDQFAEYECLMNLGIEIEELNVRP